MDCIAPRTHTDCPDGRAALVQPCYPSADCFEPGSVRQFRQGSPMVGGAWFNCGPSRVTLGGAEHRTELTVSHCGGEGCRQLLCRCSRHGVLPGFEPCRGLTPD